MCAQRVTREATYADLEALDPLLTGQLISGVLYAHPRPASEHALAASGLGMDLGGPFQRGRGGPGGWWIVDEPELHWGRDVLVPDLAGWRRERMPEMPSTKAFELPPDWVCEVLSPSTAHIDRSKKMPIYARVGVGHVWLVDPIERTLEAYALHGANYMLLGSYAHADKVRVAPFDAIELELNGLWLTPSPTDP